MSDKVIELKSTLFDINNQVLLLNEQYRLGMQELAKVLKEKKDDKVIPLTASPK